VRAMQTLCRALLPLPLLLTLAAVAQAQFTYTTTNGTITITGYTGPGGAVTSPSTITGLPVTGIGNYAFEYSSLTSVTMGTNLIRIGEAAFYGCASLGSVTIPNSVISIGDLAFYSDIRLTSVTIGSSATSLGNGAFEFCTSLTGVYFKGNAPSLGGPEVFSSDNNATVYYLPGTTGWGATYGGRPTALWWPQVQSSGASFGVRTNQFGFNINWVSGMTLVVEACTNLANPLWAPVGTNTLSGASFYFNDSQWTNYPARFYRLRWP
jgi:hypothetical protein